jgi:hypothetical protein
MEDQLNCAKIRASLEHEQLVDFLTTTGTLGTISPQFLLQTVLKFA